MKPLLHGLAIAAPTVAVLLYFSLQGREDVKQDQAEARIEQKIDAAKFDRDFGAAWNGKPVAGGREGELTALEKERDELKQRRKQLERDAERDIADLKAVLDGAGGKK